MRQTEDPPTTLFLPPEPGGERKRWPGTGTLPMTAHIADRLSRMLVLTAEIQADLKTDAGAPLRWLRCDIDHLAERIDALLQRLAS
jgi:hypothetical protein